MKLVGWKGISLSQAGKVILIRTTLQNLPTYALSLFPILAKLVDSLEAIQRKILWARPEGNKKYPLVG